MTKRAREQTFVAISGVAVAAALALGFFRLGPPSQQRAFEADLRRVEDLNRIAWQIRRLQNREAETRPPLPASLGELRASAPGLRFEDPVTLRPYDYRPIGGQEYELCAVFTTSAPDSSQRGSEAAFWSHPSGLHCFRLDAGINPPPPRPYMR